MLLRQAHGQVSVQQLYGTAAVLCLVAGLQCECWTLRTATGDPELFGEIACGDGLPLVRHDLEAQHGSLVPQSLRSLCGLLRVSALAFGGGVGIIRGQSYFTVLRGSAQTAKTGPETSQQLSAPRRRPASTRPRRRPPLLRSSRYRRQIC